MSSSICPHFAQNAWKKDLCSNCFKSKEEHKQSAVSSSASRKAVVVDATKTDYPNKHKVPARSIIKGTRPKSKKSFKVNFPKQLSEVIGYGGEWSDESNSDDDDFMSSSNSADDPTTGTDEEENLELKKLTKANTDFNMNNGNLLGDPQENIKKSFAALKLGAPQVDKEGKKQTLKINVTPFGSSSKLSTASKAKFEVKEEPVQKKELPKVMTSVSTSSVTTSSASSSTMTKTPPDGKNSPPIERAMEKSLLEEISETLEQNKSEQTKKLQAETASKAAASTEPKIKFEITSLADTLENKPFLDLKKPIARNPPITKDHIKPKINVSAMQKYSDTDSNCSDNDNCVSAYYDVVESDISYENVPDGKYVKGQDQTDRGQSTIKVETVTTNSVFSNSQYITDMLLSSKTRSATYSLHEGNFMTSKITSDGLIVTKCSSDDALDSTGSSFDGSSDEETSSYNMTRSESDSGIGISIGNDYKNSNDKAGVEKKLSASTNNSDYEDIQVADQVNSVVTQKFSLEKSREMAGEPDGSADPDGSLENQQQMPALPKSPPPTSVSHDARPSFLHGLQKNIPAKKPELPAKPVMKSFAAKRQATAAEQQVISQLQQVIKPPATPSPTDALESALQEQAKLLKKGRAPNPPAGEEKSSAPPTPERDYNITVELSKDAESKTSSNPAEEFKPSEENASAQQPQPSPVNNSSLYTRKQQTSITVGVKSTASPVIREKDKRERATVNPKFRSLNTFTSHRKTQLSQQLSASPPSSPPRQYTAKPILAQETAAAAAAQARKNFSLSEECLTMTDDLKKQQQQQQQQKKNKFSIKKFLRMGASKTTDNLHKKDGIYSEIVTGDESGVVAVGKPRLVIIHPIDINPTAVEVVKDITKTNESVASQTIVVTTNGGSGNGTGGGGSSAGGKPPAPPLRKIESGLGPKIQEASKPARPPPPKSAELRRKQQKISFDLNAAAGAGGSVKCKSDNVYANLGEIRSSIAPRKPERTASMREREAQLELARKRQGNNENADNISICSSNGEIVSADIAHQSALQQAHNAEQNKASTVQGYPKEAAVDCGGTSQTSSFERLKKLDQVSNAATAAAAGAASSDTSRPSSLKDSVRKINSTIDSYLKDKRDYENMYELVKSGPGNAGATPSTPPAPPARSVDTAAVTTRAVPRRPQQFSDNASLSGASYTRSEYGSPRYGLNSSLANIPRVISASYCGSEMGEFDIYSPYSYYGSEAGGDVATDINDSVWGIPSAIKNRTKATNRLRMRKGRSVVHKSIEDNYTAVVVANHEALAQVLDQLQQTPVIPPALRPLANAINLRFEDFTVIEGVQAFVVGKKAFHAAVWTSAPVTLALSADCNQLSGVGGELCQLTGGVSGVLNPITEFCDLVPSYHLPLMPTTEVRMLQATISVLPRLQLETLQSIGAILKNKSQMLDKSMYNFRGSIPNLSVLKDNGMNLRNVCSVQNLSSLNEDSKSSATATTEKPDETQTIPGMPSLDDVMSREVAFIMLQLINGLKNLQAKAIEEMPLSLSNVILAKDVENKDAQARLCVLQGNNNNDEEEQMGTLCRCAHIALTDMLPSTKMTSILADILLQERSESLSKAKAVLEFILWGPSDVVLSGSTKERELALQRWLDLERATVLHGLVRTRVELTIYDECHLMFLVRSNAKMMNDAAKIVSSYQQSGKE